MRVKNEWDDLCGVGRREESSRQIERHLLGMGEKRCFSNINNFYVAVLCRVRDCETKPESLAEAQ